MIAVRGEFDPEGPEGGARFLRGGAIEVGTAGVGTLAVGICLLSGLGGSFALGAVAGLALGLLHFQVLRRSLLPLFRADGTGSGREGWRLVLPLAGMVRLGLVAGLLWLAISRFRLDGMGMAVGVTLFVAVLVAVGLGSKPAGESRPSGEAHRPRTGG